MHNHEKFSLLRSMLRTLGLGAEAADDVVDWIVALLSDKGEKAPLPAALPYRLQDHFLSPAEQSFFLVLKNALGDWGVACPKVGLGELFYARSSDPSEFRIFTNKIDRKHVDFLICDPRTMRPLAGVELDDKSHQRDDRRTRDEFVEQVFSAAKLPLLRIPAQQAYSVADLRAAMRQQIGVEPLSIPPGAGEERDAAPRCPKCAGHMVLRTARSGPNAGGKFWGCSNYPRCEGITKYAQ